MAYSYAFFDLQLTFARRLAERFQLALGDRLETLAELRFCFPYQVRQPSCSITEFYSFYNIP